MLALLPLQSFLETAVLTLKLSKLRLHVPKLSLLGPRLAAWFAAFLFGVLACTIGMPLTTHWSVVRVHCRLAVLFAQVAMPIFLNTRGCSWFNLMGYRRRCRSTRL